MSPQVCGTPQGYACALCREPFEEGQRICADHDQTAVLLSLTRREDMRQCIRGLLHARCNAWLGFFEKYGELAEAYLGRARLGRPAA